MTPQALQQFLFDKIPIARAFGVRVKRSDPLQTEIQASLQPNLNHVGTAFGGSLNAVLVLACYSWLFNFLENLELIGHVVLKSSEIQYFTPVDRDFSAVCSAPAPDKVERFLKTLERKGRAQISIEASIQVQGECACTFKGRFVVVPDEEK